MVRKRKELGINLDIYTTHGEVRKHKFSARQKKWETKGAIKALEDLCLSMVKSSELTGKDTFTMPEVVCVFRIALGCHHEMLSKITGKKAHYTLKKAVKALQRDCGIDCEGWLEGLDND